MRRRYVVPIVVALTLSGAAVALAAAPKKGGVYSGIHQALVKKQIILRVSKNGKSAFASLYCAGTLASTMSNIKIHKGSFSGTRNTGSLVIWTLKGHFTSKTKAKANAFLHAVCDGGTIHLTLTLLP
jgi:hypothetical protein